MKGRAAAISRADAPWAIAITERLEDFLLFLRKMMFFAIKTCFVTHCKSVSYEGKTERRNRSSGVSYTNI